MSQRPTRQGTGWLTFASIMLVVAGLMRIVDAFWAFKYDDEINEELQAVLFENDLVAYGWIWLGLGILLIAAGIAVLQRSQWARWVGIGAAALGVLAGTSWIYVYPTWALVDILVGVLVIYALAIYGGYETPFPWKQEVPQS